MFNKQKITGLSIVELMVAMLLSLFLLGGILAVYLSNKQTYNSTQSLANIQGNLRFSMDLLTRDVRMAGYMPCRFQDNRSNVLIDNGSDIWWQDFFSKAVQGYEGGVSTFPTTLPAVGTAIGERVAGADALAIFKGDGFQSTISNNDTVANQLTFNTTTSINDLSVGEVIVICDAHQASLLQISGPSDLEDGGFDQLEYTNTADISPGNCTTSLGSSGNVVCGDTGSAQPYTFDTDEAQLIRYSPVIYYVAQSNQNLGVSALKRAFFVARNLSGVETATMQEEELLQGVETMQIRYGLDTNNDQVANQFLDANAISDADWANVISVKIGLLMASGDQITTNVDMNTYNVAGEMIAPSGPGLTHPQDRQLRHVANYTISLRNRVN